MKRHPLPIILIFSTLIFSHCSSGDEGVIDDPLVSLELELVDSLMVDELVPLRLQDYSKEVGLFILFDSKSKNPIFVDEKGEIIHRFNLSKEGPNGTGANGAFGYKFIDKERFVAQGAFSGYFIYDLQGNQIRKVANNAKELYRLSIYRNRTTFHPFVENGQDLMLGEEQNFFSNEDADYKKLGTAYYAKISGVYRYNLNSEENEILESYPELWEPRLNDRFVGPDFPFVALHDSKQKYALLPMVGNQVFVYEFREGKPILTKDIHLSHTLRPDLSPLHSTEFENSDSEYPKFNNILFSGEYLIASFSSKIPLSVITELRAKSEEYYRLPEFKEAQKKYVKTYHIVVKNGKQIGIIDNLSVNGELEFMDANGILYVNDNANPEEERDYNIFYKLKIKQ
ncbi:hypothetical protein P872_23265 [Rhodonellum psychrophilum GCM71 = DSM 17998]|uniref:Uncharacterized protein n=2 Tax=Rhodonellum TaxID=336827 RepID=U5C7P9_9BACT|nr:MULTISPECIES: DUF4221 family protein [Rhodonellum]ERM84981.1 hypothetical protein P872_23265 [Rhodonellum psychrophilum GCM71 = DSM 17998]SDY75434.1 hypothetical protein SAMN05444412_102478 [Rhodonellum ikkaensis]